METKIVKIVRLEFEDSMAELNEPHVGSRYLYATKAYPEDMKEAQVLEVSLSKAWIKMFNGLYCEWVHVEQFVAFERLITEGSGGT